MIKEENETKVQFTREIYNVRFGTTLRFFKFWWEFMYDTVLHQTFFYSYKNVI